MGAQKLSLGKRLVAGISTLAMASLAVLGAGTAANAAPVLGNIDQDRLGSITLHKHEQPTEAGLPATGEETTVDTKALDGVEFTIQQVDLDLSVWDNWEGLADLTPADVADALGAVLAEGVTGETGNAGEILFGNLPVGLYLITEGTDTGNNNIARKADPFLVVLPAQINNEWAYDLHVYPKNTVTDVEKELNLEDDANALGAGDVFGWDVTATAPILIGDDEIEGLYYVDTLDDRLNFDSISDFTYGDTELVEDTHYEVTENGQEITITFLAEGLALIQEESGLGIAYKVNTFVGEEIGDGVIANEITQFTNINGEDSEITTPDPKTYWGVIKLLKIDEANEKVLENAEFSVYPTEADALAGTNAIEINGETVFVSDANGIVEIGPLNAGAEQSRDYWVAEIAPPAGYQLLDGAVKVTVTPGVATETVTIENVKQPDVELPLTGAAGTAMFVIAGLVLLAIGGALYARNRRKATA